MNGRLPPVVAYPCALCVGGGDTRQQYVDHMRRAHAVNVTHATAEWVEQQRRPEPRPKRAPDPARSAALRAGWQRRRDRLAKLRGSG